MIRLSDHFTFKKLLKFVMPSIAMMIFTSAYVVVDGIFISNFVGKSAFAAVNLISPFLMALGSIGFMLGAGGSAIVSKTMGEGKREKANEYFSFLIVTTVIAGIVFAILGVILIDRVAAILGAKGENEYLKSYCVTYGRINLFALPFFMLQNVFQMFFTTSEKPVLGFSITVTAGVTNIILDALFMSVFKLGVTGAATATAISQAVGGSIPIIYFIRKNSSAMRLVPTRFNGKVLLSSCANGSSELMSHVSASVVSILYNGQLLKLAGENGVSAYGVIMYVNFIFISIFIGYSIGVAPIAGFNYGSKNSAELKNIFKKSLFFVGVVGLLMLTVSELSASLIAGLFAKDNIELKEMTVVALRMFSINFVICGFNIFGSAFFTALGNGIISAIISFLRTLVFQISAVFILPLFLGLNGIWISIVVAEILSLTVTMSFFITKRKKYNYA